ncbi:trafficking protein particle complex subunit 10 [Russula earlei]|uniref:Trafficking protein particle complex subunit 10 n=1 Tax=Russula earlei TaxID=71964 RepID=A0ACC0UET3_9AGAM|nr:trafficking protein particle complex subunit 10 [Russula earlei]
MSTQRVIVTYSAHQSFLSSDQWVQIHAAFSAQLPLRSIHWKSQTRPSIRTIQELEVQLVPLNTVRDENTSQVPYSLLERPLLNIYIVTCEDGDTYKSTVKKQIKDWQMLLSHRKNQEWIVVQVVRSNARNVSKNIFQIKSKVLDKIRADFNTDKRDRCVQLAWPAAMDNPAAWADLLTKVKDGLVFAFDTAVSQRDEEVKRSESQRSMPGWNFCTFFILKESLAASFEGMNLPEDALRCYDELDLTFAHVLKEKNLSWFGTLIIPGPDDDSLPLLSITKKPYRDLIVANTVSVFDLRIYMLARQCSLLAKMGKVSDICCNVVTFLTSFGRHLREVSAILPSFFIESWTHSSALSAVEQVEVWAKDIQLESILLNQFNACKGELLELARHQLDVFGIQLGLLPSRPPFSLSLPSVPISPHEGMRESRFITNPQLLKCLGNQDSFYDLYIELTNRAIEVYVKAGRRKFALRLHGSLAALDVHRGSLNSALQTYSSLPAHYAQHEWTWLESYMQLQAINVYALARTDREKQWVHIVLRYLKQFSSDSDAVSSISQEDNVKHITSLVDSLKAVVDELREPISYSEHPALSVRVLDTLTVPAEDEDGSFLRVSVLNLLPCPLPINEINLNLSGRESEKLRFCANVKVLEPGTSTFRLFCPSSSWGTYVLEQTEVVLSNLRLQWNHRPTSKSSNKPSRTKHTKPILIRLVKDPHALDVRLKRPLSVELGLGMPSKLLLVISSGRNDVLKGVLKLSGPPGLTFRFQDSVLDGHDTLASLECAADNISILNLAKNSEVAVLIPHSDASTYHTMQITILVTYNTTKEPSVDRTLSQSSRVQASLPITVNVQDFFRGERLFSRFTISSAAQQYIRVSSATLEDAMTTEGFPSLVRSHNRTITPARPAHFLFELVSQHGRVLDPLSLCIKYRMLRDEVEAVVEQAVDQALGGFSQHEPDRSRLIAHLIHALESDPGWVELYGVTGELKVPTSDDDGVPKEILTRVREMLEAGRPAVVSSPWRELRIQVDVPVMDILAAVQFRILMTPFHCGPIPASLSIQTSFHWGTRARTGRKSYQMRFDIEEMVQDWLISGRKRGDFEAEDGSTLTVPLTLVALHHGELSLPKVVVFPKPLEGEVTMKSLTLPNIEAHQVHGAEKVLIHPRGGRSTFVVGMAERE